jgi:NIPSNAP
MSVRYPIVELRQYTLRPGQRDVLIDLFDRELVESQEAAGMAVVGQFRDLDQPDRFVWIRGFGSMSSRAQALADFYGGPVWKAHSAQANATMVDSDDVLLLRPTTVRSGFPASETARPPIGHAQAGQSRILATIYYRDRPFDDWFADFFDGQVRPVLIQTGAVPLACLRTEYAENTFPALPVRADENVFMWLARFASPADLSSHMDQLERSGAWRDRVFPGLSAMLTRAPQQLRLAPTARSLLR